MYDRKTWIVIALCSAVLAANLYYSGKNRQADLARQQAAERDRATQQAANPPPPTPPTPTAPDQAKPQPTPSTEERLATLETNGTIFTFSNLGGGIKTAEIKQQPEVVFPNELVRCNRFGTTPLGALTEGPDRPDATVFTATDDPAASGDSISYLGQTADGTVIRKTFSKVATGEYGREYLLDFELAFENRGQAPVSLDRWSLCLGTANPLYQKEWEQQTGFFWRAKGDYQFRDTTKFRGGWFSKAQEVIEQDLESVEYAGVTNQFFASFLQPAERTASHVWGTVKPVTLPDGDGKTRQAITAGLRLPAVVLQPGEKKSLHYRVFAGPKQNRMLRKMGTGDVMNYGVFGLVSRFLNWVLYWIHEGMSHLSDKWSWGLAIIALTIVVRTAIWPLHNASTRTMKRMSKLQPEMQKLKEKYPGDPQRMNQEMMKLYRKYGINPMGGCLPMFVQIPIFFGFYRMLQYAVELRGKEFLWVHDLSQPDTLATWAGVPINLLPIVMAITSFVQMAMTPKTGDKTQQRIIMFMPFMFFFFCYNFASALALYWTTQNIFSIGQTWLMNKLPEVQLKAKPTSDRKSWLERFAEKQAELEKLQRDRRNVRSSGSESSKPPKKRPPRTGG